MGKTASLILRNFSKYPKLSIEKIEKVTKKLKTIKKSVEEGNVLEHHKMPLKDIVSKLSKLLSKIFVVESGQREVIIGR